MSDIFRIDTSDGIKLTGGVQQEGICTSVDTRDVRTRTELESGAQNAGGNDSSPNGGISEVYVSGCLTGSGTEANPVSIVIDPTGGISCGPNGLLVTNLVVVTGVTASSVVTSGCLTGSGTPSNPITVLLNPTGGIQCTADGLAVQFPVPTGLNNVSTSGSCLSGNGTAGSPLTLVINPTGKLHCTAAGIALQETYLTQAITSGCITGIGTAGSPIILSINATGGLHCTPGGLAIQSTYLTSVTPTGCLSGSGTLASPLAIRLSATGGLNCVSDGLALQNIFSSIVSSGCLFGSGTLASPVILSINPTGGLHCTPNGLAINATIASSIVTSGCLSGSGTLASPAVVVLNPTGGIQCTAGGLALQNTYLTSVVSSGCLTGSGTTASPVVLAVNPTGGIHCTAAGIALQQTYLTQAITSGCIGGIGTAGSPIVLSINPTGGLQCTPGGLAISSSAISTVVTSGCVSGSGTSLSPIVLFVNPTGGLQCTANGLAISQSLLSSTGGICTAWSYESGTAPLSPTQPTTPLTNLSSGNVQVEVYNNLIRFWFYNGSSFVLDKEFSGGGSGTGTPASPVNSVQFNNAGSFGGSSNFIWDGSTLSVTGNVTAKNVANLVYTIVDGTGVDINPSNGGFQVWTLGSGRVPTANSFAQGQSVTLLLDDGSGYNVDWTTIGVNWLGGTAPVLATSGYTVVDLFKIGSTVYGLSTTSGTTGTGTPASPVNSIQYNSAGSFGGSSNLLWTGSELSVTGVVSTKNVNSTVYTITDGTGVDIDPDNGGIQVWVLTSGRTPTASSFDQGQSVTLMIDDGSGYTVNWGTIGVNWLAGSAPTLATSGYTVVELWKVGSTIYGASSVDVAASTSDYFTGETNDGNSGSSITINFGTKANHKLTLTNNCTLTFTAPADARETKIRFVQGGVGGYSITLPSGTLGDTPVLPTGVGAQSVVRFYYDGDGVWHV